MKRLFLLILSFMFLGGAVSSSAFFINNGLQVTETNREGEFTTSENENLDDVTANAPTNSGYWTDAGNYATSFAGGTGTEDDPYLISTPQQLARLAYLINGSSSSSYMSLYYEQTTNLNMSAYWWDAIGYSTSYYFSGKYNGGGFTIAGLYTEAGTTSSYSYQGLFGYIEGTTSNFAEIHDVGIIDSNIQGYRYIGGIAGYAASSLTITNCYNTGSVTGSSDYVGGIAGDASYFSTITNCYNTGSVSGNNQVGGIAGSAYFSTSIKNCYNTGSVIGSAGSASRVGGIAGSASERATITNCYNTGSVSGEDDVGGIAGYASSTIRNCYWGGNCTLSVAVGGGSAATNCGTCTIEEVKSLSWYSDSSKWNSSYPWDFETVWTFVDGMNDGYPVLQAFIGPDNDGYWTDAGNYADNFAGGSGTSTDPYLISTPQQLARLAYLINGSSSSSYRSLHYEQTANLNMSAYWWDAIGYSSSYYFGGHYNGGGFTIAGLYTEAGTTSDYSYQGLFGYIEGTTSNFAEIHDVGIIDSNIQGYRYIGGIAGHASSSTITNCYNTGSVIGSAGSVGGIAGRASERATITNCYNTGSVSGQDDVGGIAGRAYFSTITNCYNTGSVTGSSYYVGGIAGYAYSSTSITNCYNTGSVIGSASRVGGIAGYAYSSTSITNCYNTGSVTGSSSWVGGIAGHASSSTITNCYNTGSVSGNNQVGGIAGNASSTITNCYNTGSVTGSSSWVGGIAGYASSTIRNCYWGGNCTLSVAVGGGSAATNCGTCTIEEVKSLSWYSDSSKWNSSYPWDFETVWVFMSGENDGYPVLRAFYMVSITFDANGGQGVMDDFKVSIGTSGILPTCTFIRTGYEFAGWATSSTGAVVYADGASITPSASMTLYAVWRAEVYTITLDWQGGSGATWSTIYFRYGGSNFYSNESCTTMINASGLLNGASRAGFSFVNFTTNSNGTGTVMFQNSAYANTGTILSDDVWYAQWTARNEAKYDSAGKYWYVENGAIPQTRVTSSSLINSLNSATTNGANYYIAGQTLQARVYNGTEYCQWNGNWYEVEPIRWRLDASSSQKDGYGTTTDTNAVLAEIVYVDQYSSSSIDAGEGYSSSSVTEFMRNGISTTYLVNYTKSSQTFGDGTSLYNPNLTNHISQMSVSSQSEITNVVGNMNMTFSDLVEDMIKYYGGTNVYFTRDLGSNYNNIVCFNEVGREVQRFATDYRGVQFTVRFTEYGCVA